jgi:hypothetical protein
MLGVDRRPELGCSGRGRYLREDLLGQGQKQVAGNLLVLDHPLLMGGIGHGISPFLPVAWLTVPSTNAGGGVAPILMKSPNCAPLMVEETCVCHML